MGNKRIKVTTTVQRDLHEIAKANDIKLSDALEVGLKSKLAEIDAKEDIVLEIIRHKKIIDGLKSQLNEFELVEA